MTVWEVVDITGSPYEDWTIARFVHKSRAEAYAEDRRKAENYPELTDGRSCIAVRPLDIDERA